jgi:hypothetical protein
MTAEKEAFEHLRREVFPDPFHPRQSLISLQVNALSGPLRRNSKILDEFDVTLAFANLAAEMNFTRPILQEEYVWDWMYLMCDLTLLTTASHIKSLMVDIRLWSWDCLNPGGSSHPTTFRSLLIRSYML